LLSRDQQQEQLQQGMSTDVSAVADKEEKKTYMLSMSGSERKKYV
jgi:hypothetical protein